jgi:hypothetical protein
MKYAIELGFLLGKNDHVGSGGFVDILMLGYLSQMYMMSGAHPAYTTTIPQRSTMTFRMLG